MRICFFSSSSWRYARPRLRTLYYFELVHPYFILSKEVESRVFLPLESISNNGSISHLDVRRVLPELGDDEVDGLLLLPLRQAGVVLPR